MKRKRQPPNTHYWSLLADVHSVCFAPVFTLSQGDSEYLCSLFVPNNNKSIKINL